MIYNKIFPKDDKTIPRLQSSAENAYLPFSELSLSAL